MLLRFPTMFQTPRRGVAATLGAPSGVGRATALSFADNAALRRPARHP